MRITFQWLCVLLVSFCLSACGGGGSSSSDNTKKTDDSRPKPPIPIEDRDQAALESVANKLIYGATLTDTTMQMANSVVTILMEERLALFSRESRHQVCEQGRYSIQHNDADLNLQISTGDSFHVVSQSCFDKTTESRVNGEFEINIIDWIFSDSNIRIKADVNYIPGFYFEDEDVELSVNQGYQFSYEITPDHESMNVWGDELGLSLKISEPVNGIDSFNDLITNFSISKIHHKQVDSSSSQNSVVDVDITFGGGLQEESIHCIAVDMVVYDSIVSSHFSCEDSQGISQLDSSNVLSIRLSNESDLIQTYEVLSSEIFDDGIYGEMLYRYDDFSSDFNKVIYDIQSTASVYLKEKDTCLLYTSPSPRDKRQSRMPSSA